MGLPVMLIIQITIYIILPVWLYLWFTKGIKNQFPGKSGFTYSIPDLHFLLKLWWAEWCLRAKSRSKPRVYEREYKTLDYVKSQLADERLIKDENSSNSLFFYGADQKGDLILVKFTRKARRIAEVYLQFNLHDGRTYVLPDYPNTVYATSNNQEWSAAGLKIEELDLHARWRIVYNGLLRDLSKEGEQPDQSVEHVRLNFIFIASTKPVEWPADWSLKLHSDALAKEEWRSPQWMSKIKSLDNNGLDYWGSMIGQATFKDSSVCSLYLRGISLSRWGKHDSHEFRKSVTIYGTMENGLLCYLGASNTRHSFREIQFGHVKTANKRICKPTWMDLDLDDFNEDNCSAGLGRTIRFVAEGIVYNVTLKFGNSTTFYSGQPWNWAIRVASVKFEVNGKTGVGVMQLCYPYTGECPSTVIVKPQYLKQSSVNVRKEDYVVFFGDGKCQNESIVGGKGYSLAVLSSIKEPDFVVPQGFCVTVFAFDLQLKSHKELQDLIDDVRSISAGKMEGDLEKACESAMLAIETTPIIEPVVAAIVKAVESLESTSGDNEKDERARYAIRSSAVGEDSEETSAAGQNSTYLGVKGKESIVKNVAKCWASLFSYQSVQYRRQHGLLVKASMGVCVQKMVKAEAAGVMFTRHPTTGDPSSIIITANYGLGETVVSATVEPDTIMVHRSWDNRLRIKETVVGTKTEMISMTDDGVATTKLAETETKRVSISEKMALRLAEIGVSLENLFGSARDVEWAVSGDEIFLLQARPITTLYTWTDFELEHELDTGVPSDIDITTFANVGEVFPKPLSPLTVSTITRVWNFSLGFPRPEFDAVYLQLTSGRMLMNYYDSMLQYVESKITMVNEITDIAVCGHRTVTPEIHRTALERNGLISAREGIAKLLEVIVDIWTNAAAETRAIEIHNDFSLNEKGFDTSCGLYREISKKLNVLYDISLSHFHTSRVSIIYQVYAMLSLTSGYETINHQHFTDIGILLSTYSSAVSSEVPILLKKISRCIMESGKAEEFGKLDPKAGVEWMKNNCPEATKHLETFLANHGTRCIQEMDLASEPWILKPEKLISTIQTISLSLDKNANETTIKELTTDEVLANLKTPKSWTAKWILRRLIPLCKKSVERREKTKSLMVYAIHKFRLAYRRLGALMVNEGYLPDEKLIFYLTHREIGQMLSNHNSSLIQKAQRRIRIYSKLEKLQYPELNVGMPMPIKSNADPAIRHDSTKVQGTSVCGGSILGRACVVRDLSQTKLIQNGDILITVGTDIGWSPYFPLLGGVVTELGGLISHGAVVAREYGLPCIVGAKGATNMFQTGDTVLLVAEAGVLQLVEKVEQ